MSTMIVTCPRCKWPFHLPVEQMSRILCRACQSKAATQEKTA